MSKFASAEDELKHLAEEMQKDISKPRNAYDYEQALLKWLRAAFDVGHRTTTTDDWVHLWD